MSKSKKNKPPELTMHDLEQVTFDAMRHCGMAPPMTIEEIAAIEAELPNIKLPFRPSDPRELLKRLGTGSSDESAAVLPFPKAETESVRNLARAARDGGDLTADVEQRMADDKAKYLQNEHGDQ